MKSSLLITVLMLTTLTITCGQDKDLETRFFTEKATIKKSKIKEITESRHEIGWSRCIEDCAEIRFKYEFNRNGDLVRVDEFDKKRFYKAIKYTRNESGNFIEKSYLYYDTLGNVRGVDNWTFKFNKKGERVLEIWIRGKDTVRTNILSYDNKGNYTEQVMDGRLKWRFKYDENNLLIESDQCHLQGDSTQCHSLTKYLYEQGLLKHKIIYSSGDKIWKEYYYTYDSKRLLIECKEKWNSTVTTQYGNGPKTTETRVRETTISFENDDKGNCLVKTEFNSDNRPIRRTYYDYKYY